MLMTVSSSDEIPRRSMQPLQHWRKKFDLTVEDTKDEETDLSASLGVEVKVDKNTYEMTFLQRMEDCTAKPTPACTTPLGTADRPQCQLSWDYASMIGMLIYLIWTVGQHPICCASMCKMQFYKTWRHGCRTNHCDWSTCQHHLGKNRQELDGKGS